RQVQVPVLVKIPESHAVHVRLALHWYRCSRRCLESSSPISQEHTDVLCLVVGDNEIKGAIAVEVTGRKVVRRVSRWKGRACGPMKLPGPVAQQNGYIIARFVGHDHVGLAVEVYVRDKDCGGSAACRDAGRQIRESISRCCVLMVNADREQASKKR